MSLGQTLLAAASRWVASSAFVMLGITAHAQSTAGPSGQGVDLPFECGTLENPYGPFDYTNPADVAEHLPIVERFHFNNNVEQLISGQSSARPGDDLDYTLRAFPNHHRALYAMARYALKYTGDRIPPGANYPGECYLLRAIKFKPVDANVRIIYGIYLSKLRRDDEALAQYEKAAELAPRNAEVHYNLGLLYRKLHRFEEALKHAQIAYQLGYPLPGLKEQLKKDGVWKPSAEVKSSAKPAPQSSE